MMKPTLSLLDVRIDLMLHPILTRLRSDKKPFCVAHRCAYYAIRSLHASRRKKNMTIFNNTEDVCTPHNTGTACYQVAYSTTPLDDRSSRMTTEETNHVGVDVL